MGTDRNATHDDGAVGPAGVSVGAQVQLDLFGSQDARGVDGAVESPKPASPPPAHGTPSGTGGQLDIFWVEEDDCDIVWVSKVEPVRTAGTKQDR